MDASISNAQVYYVENHYSSEMHFLARPRGQAEDDGVLVTIVFDGVKAQVGWLRHWCRHSHVTPRVTSSCWTPCPSGR